MLDEQGSQAYTMFKIVNWEIHLRYTKSNMIEVR